MTHLDYTWEQREKLIRKEEYEQGIEHGIDAITKMISKGYSKDQILELDYSEEEYHQALQRNCSTKT